MSNFYESKNDMVEPMCQLLHDLKNKGIDISIIRCNNSGENTELNKVCNGKDWKLNLLFEYTARATPQQNSIAEVAFYTISSQARAIW